MGTDFTYEEIKKEQKNELTDYTFKAAGTEIIESRELLIVEGIPLSKDISTELGVSRVIWRVDPNIC